jgi:hypothetical protein
MGWVRTLNETFHPIESLKNPSVLRLLTLYVAAWEQAILDALPKGLVGAFGFLVLDFLEDFGDLLASPLKIFLELCWWEVLLGPPCG